MMGTEKTTWLLTIKHPNGQPLFALLVESEPVGGTTTPPPSPSPAARTASPR